MHSNFRLAVYILILGMAHPYFSLPSNCNGMPCSTCHQCSCGCANFSCTDCPEFPCIPDSCAGQPCSDCTVAPDCGCAGLPCSVCPEYPCMQTSCTPGVINQVVWIANKSGNWYEPGNWCPPFVPSASDDVVLPSLMSPLRSYTVYFGTTNSSAFYTPPVCYISSLHIGSGVYFDLWGAIHAASSVTVDGTLNMIIGNLESGE